MLRRCLYQSTLEQRVVSLFVLTCKPFSTLSLRLFSQLVKFFVGLNIDLGRKDGESYGLAADPQKWLFKFCCGKHPVILKIAISLLFTPSASCRTNYLNNRNGPLLIAIELRHSQRRWHRHEAARSSVVKFGNSWRRKCKQTQQWQTRSSIYWNVHIS